MKTRVYRDNEFERTTIQEIESAQKALQGLLDKWNSLDIGPCPDIFELLMAPEKVCIDRIDSLVEVPSTGGRFEVKKEIHLRSLDLPDTSELCKYARTIRQQTYCASQNLWNIENNRIAWIYDECEVLIDARSIYSEDPEQIRLVKDLVKYASLSNSINERLSGMLLPPTPWVTGFCRGKFLLTQSVSKGTVTQNIEVDPEWLKSLMA